MDSADTAAVVAPRPTDMGSIGGQLVDAIGIPRMSIEEIAWSLSKLDRFNGHLTEFYSVARHSLEVSYWLEDEGEDPYTCFCGLMHDAHESIVGDVVSPVKEAIRVISKAVGSRDHSDWDILEIAIQRVLLLSFGIETPLPAAVKEADMAVGDAEASAFLPGRSSGWGRVLVDGESLRPHDFRFDYFEFLERYKELTDG